MPREKRGRWVRLKEEGVRWYRNTVRLEFDKRNENPVLRKAAFAGCVVFWSALLLWVIQGLKLSG